MILIKVSLEWLTSQRTRVFTIAMSRRELVCYCFAVTEAEVASAITAGARTLGALRKELGVSTCCGGCEPRIRDCLQHAESLLPATLCRVPGASAAPVKSPITNP